MSHWAGIVVVLTTRQNVGHVETPRAEGLVVGQGRYQVEKRPDTPEDGRSAEAWKTAGASGLCLRQVSVVGCLLVVAVTASRYDATFKARKNGAIITYYQGI